jgi:hypothetical protein
VAAAACGAVTAGAAAESIAALSAYAKNLGLAFQIVDDLLDVAGDRAHRQGRPRRRAQDDVRLVQRRRRRAAARGGAVPDGGSRARRRSAPGRIACASSPPSSRSDACERRPRTGRPRVDDLRQQLKSLGYLDAGVDRFLLAPARGTRVPSRWPRARACASGARRRAPRPGGGARPRRAPARARQRLRDALVLALYLGVLFFLAVAASRSSSASAPRHGRACATIASPSARAVVSGTRLDHLGRCLVYLTFWWRNANAGFGWSAPVWTAFALAVAVGTSLLLVTPCASPRSRSWAREGDPAALPQSRSRRGGP